jgi:nitroreductase
MDVFDAIRTLLAVRKYSDKPVPPDVMRRVVESAHLTASSINLQPWHFVVIEERHTLQQLGSLARTGPYTAQAAFAVAVAYERESVFGVSDASRAIQNMMLTAWDAGVGSNWVGFGGLEDAAKLLQIPDSLELLALVPFGYPAERIGRGRKKRKPLGEVVSRERYGQPFE